MKAHEAISEGLLLLSAILLTASLPHRTVHTTQPTAVRTANAAPMINSSATAATPAPKAVEPTRTIVVSLEDRRLALLEDGQVKQVYTVAVGTDSTPSPTGTFTIVRRVANPTYTHDGQVIPPGPDNPVGTRWMGLSKPGYGIHGTNAPKSIGKAASHGCIRMARPDLENLYAQVRTGDTVQIIGERDDQTIALFGAPEAPLAPAAAPTVLAQSTQPATQPAATTADNAATAIAAAVPIGQ
ncbi:MAG TPA: L,D-transpeptidase [Acidobacteriaceae bacterium]|jgi:lipoprotein-anchoring transpeptidase ErfK/SrfK|nr:L,D-transpeptidase [Acidobacteriaceae bacterium]